MITTIRQAFGAAVLGLTLTLASVFVQGAVAQDEAPAPKPGVTVDLSGGYARLLFAFARPASVSATLADGILTIKLTQPSTARAEDLAAQLGSYVTAGRRDPDGLTYRFALAQTLALHTSSSGNSTAVDLVPDHFKGAPPDLPPPPPAKPKLPDMASLPVIKVRVGEYANYTRLIFDWPADVVYAVYPGQGRVSVRFQTLAKPDFSMIENRAPAWVKSAGWHLEDKSMVVDFATDADASFKDSRDGHKIYIDVLAPKTDAQAIAPQPKVAAAPLAPPPAGSDAAMIAGGSKPSAEADAATEEPAEAPPVRPASSEMTRDGAIIHFPSARGKSIAVYYRGPVLWVVVDDPTVLDPVSLLSNIQSVLDSANVSQEAGASILRLTFKSGLLASVSEDQNALNVVLSQETADPPQPVLFTRESASGGAALTSNLPGAKRTIIFDDPDVGDRLVLVPARPGRGVLTPKNFVEFSMLPTAAGVAIAPIADDLQVRVNDDRVAMMRPRGLALSSSSGASSEPIVQMAQSSQGATFIDFNAWSRAENGSVFEAERTLRDAIARLPESDSNKGRLRMARYMVAHNLAAEALGLVGLMQASDQSLANDAGLQTIKGAAQYMMGRYVDARQTFSEPRFDTDPHASLWRGMAEAKLQDWTHARHDLTISEPVLHLYPKEWQTEARLNRAKTALAMGDLATADQSLNALSSNLSPKADAEAKLLNARLLIAQGHSNTALAALRALESSGDAQIAANATYVRVDAELTAKKIKPSAAIEDLEKLRFRWRGDDLELKTLRKLGALYFAAEKWREGMETLRTAALYFPNTDAARDAQDDMRRAFSELFLDGKADSMEPVKALAMFYDFTELTPIGRDGDEMIRRLADRLVAVDLLAPAEDLLNHQVTNRLDGVAKAIVATKLTMIYLLDHKPQDALRVLNDSRQTRLPDQVTLQRRLLEARALAELKQYDAAIDLVADDDSAAGKQLRADIYWNSGNWAQAAAKSEDILGNRWNDSAALSDAERTTVMRAAIAYSLARDATSLERLKSHYGDHMKNSPDASAFAVVSEKIDRQGVAFRDLAKQIASVDTLKSFISDFQKSEAPAAAAKATTN